MQFFCSCFSVSSQQFQNPFNAHIGSKFSLLYKLREHDLKSRQSTCLAKALQNCATILLFLHCIFARDHFLLIFAGLVSGQATGLPFC